MKYMLLMYADESKALRTPEDYQTVAQAWTNLRQELSAAEVLLSNNGLDPHRERHNGVRAGGQEVDQRWSLC